MENIYVIFQELLLLDSFDYILKIGRSIKSIKNSVREILDVT